MSKDDGKRIRGSTELRLSLHGRNAIAELNKQIVKKGCFLKIYYSSQMRAAETAHIVAQNCPSMQFMAPSKELESWHLGGYEGQLVKDALPHIQDLVKNRPWVIPVGMGDASTKPGESFNKFKSRCLDCVQRVMEEWEQHPTKRIAIITHFHNIQLIDSWLARYKGEPGPGDDEYDPVVYNNETGYPGEVIWLHKLSSGVWKFAKIVLEKMPILLPGIYFIRHGDTAWN